MKSINIVILSIFFILFSNKIFAQNITELPNQINQPDYEIVSPNISFDGTKLVFVALKNDSSYICESTIEQGRGWSESVRLDSVNKYFVSPLKIESPAYNSNANELYFAVISDDLKSDIYLSKKKKGNWAKPEKLPYPINTEAYESDPFISPDGQTLYFVRNYENDDIKDYISTKIYYSEKTNTGWTKPLPLPNPVNDVCDRAPRLSADGKTFYLSSIREEGKGGYDIYYAKIIAKNVWLSPVPIDTLNTEADELYASVTAIDNKMYFQKGEGKKRKRIEKIYSSEIPQQFKPDKKALIKGSITDLKTKKPITAKIDIIDPNSSVILSSYESDFFTGEYSFFLQKGRKYRIDVYKDNYSHYFFTYDTRRLTENKIENIDINLYPEIDLILNVYDNEIFEPFAADIKIIDLLTGKTENIPIQILDKGRYSLVLPVGKSYKISAEKKYFEQMA